MREDFQQEVGIMKELDHPNICTVYESYDHGRHVYLVMEYCAGGAGSPRDELGWNSQGLG